MSNAVTYGFVGLEALWAERVTVVGESVIYDAIRESALEHTRQLSALLSSFSVLTVKHKIKFRLPGTGTLQPLDEYGNPLPVRPGGSYNVAFPIQGGGDAWGTNRITRELMTVDEANSATLDGISRDADWMRRHMLAAVLDNTPWTFDDSAFGDLTIEPLANGDAVTYARRGGVAETDDHYSAQGAEISNLANPYPAIYDDLMEHPSNTGPVVVYISASLKLGTEGLTDFVPKQDKDVVPGSGTDTLSAEFGEFDDSVRGFGDAVIGKANGCLIVEWKSLPAGYWLAHARGAGEVLAQREYDALSLQGFFPEEFSPDGNLKVVRMLRFTGFGVKNRIAAMCGYVGGGTYVAPAGYETPLAI